MALSVLSIGQITAGICLIIELVLWGLLFVRHMSRTVPEVEDVKRRKHLIGGILFLLPVFSITAMIALLAPDSGHAMEEVTP